MVGILVSFLLGPGLVSGAFAVSWNTPIIIIIILVIIIIIIILIIILIIIIIIISSCSIPRGLQKLLEEAQVAEDDSSEESGSEDRIWKSNRVGYGVDRWATSELYPCIIYFWIFVDIWRYMWQIFNSTSTYTSTSHELGAGNLKSRLLPTVSAQVAIKVSNCLPSELQHAPSSAPRRYWFQKIVLFCTEIWEYPWQHNEH